MDILALLSLYAISLTPIAVISVIVIGVRFIRKEPVYWKALFLSAVTALIILPVLTIIGIFLFRTGFFRVEEYVDFGSLIIPVIDIAWISTVVFLASYFFYLPYGSKKAKVLLVVLSLGPLFIFHLVMTLNLKVAGGPAPMRYWFSEPKNYSQCMEYTDWLIKKDDMYDKWGYLNQNILYMRNLDSYKDGGPRIEYCEPTGYDGTIAPRTRFYIDGYIESYQDRQRRRGTDL